MNKKINQIYKNQIFSFKDIFFVKICDIQNGRIDVDEIQRESDVMWSTVRRSFRGVSELEDAYTNQRLGILWIEPTQLSPQDVYDIIYPSNVNVKCKTCSENKTKMSIIERLKKWLKDLN